jgi:hypothetical protein
MVSLARKLRTIEWCQDQNSLIRRDYRHKVYNPDDQFWVGIMLRMVSVVWKINTRSIVLRSKLIILARRLQEQWLQPLKAVLGLSCGGDGFQYM